MSKLMERMHTTDERPDEAPRPSGSPVVVLRRRTIDAVLISFGAVAAVVFAVAGGLLTWGSSFAGDYVDRELSSQNVVFPDAAALEGGGRADLVEYAGQQVDTGDEAEAYASYIDGHLADVAGGATYADLGGPERAAKAAVQTAKDNGAPQAEIDRLQAEATKITGQRDTLFRGETLRGLLLSAFAWATIGEIAGIAAIVAFAAAGMMVVLVAMGLVHHRRTAKG